MVIRLDKYLCDMQAGTRSAVKDIIRKKRVTINGEVITRPEIKVDIDKDVVAVDNNVLGYSEYEYYMLNKPSGVLTATMDKNAKTVLDLMDVKRKDLFPVGRLDKDTEGLLLMTNDGELANLLMHPRYKVDKTYVAKVEGLVQSDDLKRLRKGVKMKDGHYSARAKAKVISSDRAKNHSIVSLTIHEGRNHQVKNMFEAIGHPVMKLKRETYDFLTLKGLTSGQYRELSNEEVKTLYENARKNSKLK